MNHSHDRAFYRLPYPPAAAPRFVQAGRPHRVVDLGEGGFRYAPQDAELPAVGTIVTGVIEFRGGGDPLEVEGNVVRIQDGEVAVHCAERPIPLSVVLREQRRLLARFRFREGL